jgi:hypothetical protein
MGRRQCLGVAQDIGADREDRPVRSVTGDTLENLRNSRGVEDSLTHALQISTDTRAEVTQSWWSSSF